MAKKEHRQTRPQQHISEDADGERQYVLHPEDNDLFVRTGRQVIEGSRLSISVEVWFGECQEMFRRVANWVKDAGRVGRVLACYGLFRSTGITLFFVPCSESFDFDLADELAEFNAELVRGLNVGPVETHQLPSDELDRFLPPGAFVRIYGDATRSHQPVGT